MTAPSPVLNTDITVTVTLHPLCGAMEELAPFMRCLPRESHLQLKRPPDVTTNLKKIQGTEKRVKWHPRMQSFNWKYRSRARHGGAFKILERWHFKLVGKLFNKWSWDDYVPPGGGNVLDPLVTSNSKIYPRESSKNYIKKNEAKKTRSLLQSQSGKGFSEHATKPRIQRKSKSTCIQIKFFWMANNNS